MRTGIYVTKPGVSIHYHAGGPGITEEQMDAYCQALEEYNRACNVDFLLGECVKHAEAILKLNPWFEKLDSPEAKQRKANAIQSAESLLRDVMFARWTLQQRLGPVDEGSFKQGFLLGFQSGVSSARLEVTPDLERRAEFGMKHIDNNKRKAAQRQNAKEAKWRKYAADVDVLLENGVKKLTTAYRRVGKNQPKPVSDRTVSMAHKKYGVGQRP